MKAALVLASIAASVFAIDIPGHKYLCVNNGCVQQQISFDLREAASAPTLMGLTDCEATCGAGNLWPLPTSVDYGTDRRLTKAINVASIKHSVSGASSDLVKAIQGNFNDVVNTKNLDDRTFLARAVSVPGEGITIKAKIKSKDETLSLQTDESYSLTVDGTKISIEAATVYGYCHALTTLAQLIDYSDYTKSVRMVNYAKITDRQAYTHRGITLDTSRNFYSVASIKRLIKTMGANKLNTFHWHITDSSSFPLEIVGEPRINQYGAYSADRIYTQTQVKELVAYGKEHGVRIIPEFDVPSHAGAGWQWGPDSGFGDLTLCCNEGLWTELCLQPPCGQLNPLNENIYAPLTTVFKEINDLFDADILHMGADEVSINCWNASSAITKSIKDRTNKQEFFDLWGKFQQRVETIAVGKTGKKVMVWLSDLTTPTNYKYLPKNTTIIQVWSDVASNDVGRLTEDGYQVVVSNYDILHYLDCGFGDWMKGDSWCNPYKTWQLIYDFDVATNASNKSLVLGGEVAMWSEMADDHVFEAKVWPRASAIAERLWTNPKTNWTHAMTRMRIQRDRIAFAGVGADAVDPAWCRQNPTQCQLV
ncbi:hypothetical protein AeNC1_005344 [Aphanomyces euteiches]|nr:hypothetical protein AeNC1_005344 [Aphanomyces euteiches]